MRFVKWLWFWRRLMPGKLRPPTAADTKAAASAKAEAERKLRAARRDWPKVQAAHDDLAEWLDSALGRGLGRGR